MPLDPHEELMLALYRWLVEYAPGSLVEMIELHRPGRLSIRFPYVPPPRDSPKEGQS